MKRKTRPMGEILETNRALWDAWTDLHQDSELYDLESFRRGESTLHSIELEAMGEVAGLSLLHLQCHFGLDTLSWARLGAEVTGVDLSPKAIERARQLAEEANLEARFVEADVLTLPEALPEAGAFDRVFTSYGVLGWLEDLEAWARVIDFYLRPGGELLLVEFHPVLDMLSDDARRFEYSYFRSVEAIHFETVGTYAGGSDRQKREGYGWNHSFGEIFSALLGTGFEIRTFRELDYSPYNCFPFSEEVEPGRSIIPGLEGKIPMTYVLRAVKRTTDET